jgi:hypothetical protein
MTTTAACVAAATPDTRDRYVDLLRVGSLGAVIVGHWLMAVVVVGQDGSVTATNALATLPALQPLTWLFQVMPVFFVVGGFSHAVALGSLERRGGTYADFVQSRVGRLLRPTVAFAAAWLAFGLSLELLGRSTGTFALATRVIAQPLWFVGIYLGVVAVAPLMLRWHRRHGIAVPAVLAVGVAVVDLLRFGLGVEPAGYLNFALVWLAAHQSGFFYADGALLRAGRRAGLRLAGGGLVAVVVLTTFGPYPVSMVGMPGERVSNMAPPTVALLAHTVWITGVVLVLRAPAQRWLLRARVWRAVVSANGVAMTAFLWHLTAMFVLIAGALWAGLPQPAAGTSAWWAQRLLWLPAFVLATAALVAAFRWADRPRPAVAGAARRRGENPLAALGIAICVVGVLGLSVTGFGGILAGRSAPLVIRSVTPVSSTVALLVGWALVARPRARVVHHADDQSRGP